MSKENNQNNKLDLNRILGTILIFFVLALVMAEFLGVGQFRSVHATAILGTATLLLGAREAAKYYGPGKPPEEK